MSDFLHSIRNRNNNNDKSYSQNQRSSRPYDNGNSYNRNNNNNDRKFRPKNDYNQQRDETMTRIKEALESIAANQVAMIEVADRRALAEERKADAIEHIASVIGSGNQLFDTVLADDVAPCESVVEEEEEVVEELAVEAAPVKKPAAREKAKAKKPAARKTAAKKAPAKKSAKASADMDKDAIMELIQKMRKKGDTYNEIAANLTEMKLPTFSGRGKWHAQTIHRLCQLG